MDTLESYNRNSDPVPSRRGIMRDLVGSLMAAAFILAFALALGGCYGAPIDTRDIDAEEVTITQHTPWSQTTITAKGWRSRVKAQEFSANTSPNSPAK